MNVRSFYGKKKTVAAPTLNELLDNITACNFNSADVFITPPGDVSDGDSDKSDTEQGSDYIADHLTGKILNAPAEATINAEDNEDSNGEEEASAVVPEQSSKGRPASKKRKILKTVEKWKKDCIMDLAFLIDNSWEIATDDNGEHSPMKWKQIQHFYQRVVETLNIGPSDTHVASITFEKETAFLYFDLNKGQTRDGVVALIGDIEHNGKPGGRNPTPGLQMAKTQVFNATYGDRSAIPNVVVLLTKEVSDRDMLTVMTKAEVMKYVGTSIIWIAVSNEINVTAMTMTVTAPPSENFFKVSDLDSLSDIVENIAVATCRAARNPINGCVMDLAFLIDHSSGIAEDADGKYSEAKWNLIRNFFQRLVQTLDVGPLTTHVASSTFGKHGAFINFELVDGQIKDKVETFIGVIEPKEGPDGINTTSRLHVAKTRLFNSTFGDRSAIPNVLVLITKDVSSTDMTKEMLIAEVMKDLGTSIIWIGISDTINAPAMKMVVTAPPSENFFPVSELENLNTIVDNIAMATCRAAKKRQNDCVMDLAFLIDYSPSMAADGRHSPEKWSLILNFFQSVVQTLDVGPSAIHVASVTFGNSNVLLSFDFNRGQTKDRAAELISDTKHKGGSPDDGNPVSGLDITNKRVFNTTYGDRSAIPNVLVLLTDEVSNEDMMEVRSKVKIMKYLGTSIIWIGVSDGVNATAMKMVVTAPASKNFFAVPKLENLYTIVDDIAVATCRAVRNLRTDCVMDLAFVVDFSRIMATDVNGKYSTERWNLTLHFLQTLVGSLDVGPSATRVALWLFGGKSSRLCFNLTQGQTKDYVIAEIGKIENSDEEKNLLSSGLHMTNKLIFNERYGDRPATPNVLVFITDALFNKTAPLVIPEANKIKDSGTSIIGIGVSTTINATIMNMAVSAPSSDNYFSLESVDNLIFSVQEIAMTACRAARNRQDAHHS